MPDRRLSPAVEATAYFVVSEALANVAKYASATQASVGAESRGTTLHVEVGDNGVGGADASRGSGIRGLQDRVAALGGRVTIDQPAGAGNARDRGDPDRLTGEVNRGSSRTNRSSQQCHVDVRADPAADAGPTRMAHTVPARSLGCAKPNDSQERSNR